MYSQCQLLLCIHLPSLEPKGKPSWKNLSPKEPGLVFFPQGRDFNIFTAFFFPNCFICKPFSEGPGARRVSEEEKYLLINLEHRQAFVSGTNPSSNCRNSHRVRPGRGSWDRNRLESLTLGQVLELAPWQSFSLSPWAQAGAPHPPGIKMSWECK